MVPTRWRRWLQFCGSENNRGCSIQPPFFFSFFEISVLICVSKPPITIFVEKAKVQYPGIGDHSGLGSRPEFIQGHVGGCQWPVAVKFHTLNKRKSIGSVNGYTFPRGSGSSSSGATCFLVSHLLIPIQKFAHLKLKMCCFNYSSLSVLIKTNKFQVS